MQFLVDFNAKLGRENKFKSTIRNKKFHQNVNDNGVE